MPREANARFIRHAQRLVSIRQNQSTAPSTEERTPYPHRSCRQAPGDSCDQSHGVRHHCPQPSPAQSAQRLRNLLSAQPDRSPATTCHPSARKHHHSVENHQTASPYRQASIATIINSFAPSANFCLRPSTADCSFSAKVPLPSLPGSAAPLFKRTGTLLQLRSATRQVAEPLTQGLEARN